MRRLILLDGPPGVGKSTVAARYAAEHPGALVCDIDVLRTLVAGWADDYEGAGALVRPAARAMIGAYLRESGDVVLPQLLASEEELDRFVAVGTEAGARTVEVLLMADAETCVRRFWDRDLTSPHARAARTAVEASGGDELLRTYHAALLDLAGRRPWMQVLATDGTDVGATYAAVLRAL